MTGSEVFTHLQEDEYYAPLVDVDDKSGMLEKTLLRIAGTPACTRVSAPSGVRFEDFQNGFTPEILQAVKARYEALTDGL